MPEGSPKACLSLGSSEMLRILLVTSSYPLDSESPSGIFIGRLAKQLAISNHITVITPGDNKNFSIIQQGNITIVPFRYAPKGLQNIAHAPGGIPVALKKNPLNYLLLPMLLIGMFFACIRHGKEKDIIHANWAICGAVSGIAGKFIQKHVITTLRGEDVTRASKKGIDATILQTCVGLSRQIVGVSEAIVTYLEGRITCAKGKTTLIENGVDNRFLEILPSLKKKEELNLIFIGSLIPRKGISIIVRAIASRGLRKNVSLTIVGEGHEKNTLLELVQSLGVTRNVKFTGATSPDEIPELLKQHDALVLSSYSEGRPNVILEAMASAMPVLASNIEGVNELVEPQVTGFLFEPGDSEQLAAQIVQMLNVDLRKKMGEAARQSIINRGLVWEETANRYIKVYQQVIEGKK